MKTIYLKTNAVFEPFNYTRISELNNEFKKRNIQINKRCVLSDCVYIGDNVFIDRCKIGKYVSVGDNSKIGCNSKIMPWVEIGLNCTLKDEVKIFENSVISNGCFLDKKSVINKNSIILSNSFIGKNVTILESVIVNENSKIIKTLEIKCIRHHICFNANSKLTIAYNSFTINEWIENADKYLRELCFYSKDEIDQYKIYISKVKEFQEQFDKFKNIAE